MSDGRLTRKRQRFVEAYVGEANCNATRAASIAGYGSPRAEGSRLLKEPAVREAIAARMREWALTQEEIVARLSEQARSDMGDFIDVLGPGSFRIDLTEAETSGKLRLIRRIGYDPKGRPSLELYDAQGALLALAKRYHLFPDRQELTGADGGPVRVGISYEEALTALREGAVTEANEIQREEDDPVLGAVGI